MKPSTPATPLRRLLGLLNVALPVQAPEKLQAYERLLVEKAKPMGLVGFDQAEVPEQIVRSLMLVEVLQGAESVADVGSGAGLPGIPLAIAGFDVTFIEPKDRAVAFIEAVSRALGLEVVVVKARAEDVSMGPLGKKFDAVVARALAPLPKALSLCEPLCQPEGRIVLTAAPSPTGHFSGVITTELEGPLAIRQWVHIMAKTSVQPRNDPRRPLGRMS